MLTPTTEVAKATMARSIPSRTMRSGASAEMTPPKARTAEERIHNSAQIGTRTNPTRKVFLSGDDMPGVRSTTRVPIATMPMLTAIARRSAYWITPLRRG